MSDIDYMDDFKYDRDPVIPIRRRCRRRPLSVVAPGAPVLLDGTWPAETPDDAQPLLRRRCGSRLPEPPGSRRVTPRFWWCARAEETLRTRPRHTSACPPIPIVAIYDTRPRATLYAADVNDVGLWL